MTSVRLIPCLDIRDGRVVKGVQFEGIRDAGDPLELASFYNEQGADELVFLDITASHERRQTVVDLARAVAERIFIPFTVGGGISEVSQIRDVLLAGADKVSLNTAAVKSPEMIREASERFGSQCVVMAIDARRKPTGGWEVTTHGGRNSTELDAIEWAQQVVSLGAGEILLTSMDADGSRQGYDLELTRSVSESVQVPVIASGGAGTAQHMADAVKIGKADAMLLAGILHDGVTTIPVLKEELRTLGLPMRAA